VAAQRPDVHFVVVGDGPLLAAVEAEIHHRDLNSAIHLTGLRRDVPDLMHSFDIFALSSLWEGLPRVLPQAMAAGLPIVATAVDGNAEAVTDGVNGLLTPPGDVQRFAEALLALLADPTLATRMGQMGLVKVDEFGARNMVQGIDLLYEELQAQRGDD
jgi:glycosyltransferase involved in cell wall biosynthesis